MGMQTEMEQADRIVELEAQLSAVNELWAKDRDYIDYLKSENKMLREKLEDVSSEYALSQMPDW